MRHRLLCLSAVLFAALVGTVSTGAQDVTNPNIRFGMPSPAKKDANHRDAYLIARPQYVLSYNATTRTPNWVSWVLRKSDIGNAKRGAFKPDPLLPAGFTQVTSAAYTGSGFHRGHMCPAADRSTRPPHYQMDSSVRPR
ncbi:MAG TPA: DNA/RNA non-specific endonuclease [Gemmataceae bacterium]|nr:DNA/RNA non-specific endonuclease [Gemmataceae bacterium]